LHALLLERKGDFNMDKEKYLKKRKMLSKAISITVYISFICYLLGDIQSIANWNYNVHEMLYLPVSFSLFAIPIGVLTWLYFAIKSYGTRGNSGKPELKAYLKNSLILISLILIITYFIIQSQSVTTTGIFKISNKIYEKRNYYIVINDKKVKCTWNEYNLIDEGKSYLITFKWNTYSRSQNKVEYIEPIK
jgi:hypothetical protein